MGWWARLTGRGAEHGSLEPVRRAPEPGWQDLPVQRLTFGAPELVADPQGFRAGLATWRDPSFLAPLGHLVSAQAPSGTGHGLAAPTRAAQVGFPAPPGRAGFADSGDVGATVQRALVEAGGVTAELQAPVSPGVTTGPAASSGTVRTAGVPAAAVPDSVQRTRDETRLQRPAAEEMPRTPANMTILEIPVDAGRGPAPVDRSGEDRSMPLQRVLPEPGPELTVARTVDLPVRTLTVAPRAEWARPAPDAGGPTGREDADPVASTSVFASEAVEAELVGDRPLTAGPVEPVETGSAGRADPSGPVGAVSVPLVGDRPLTMKPVEPVVQRVEQPPALVEEAGPVGRAEVAGPVGAVSVPLVGDRPLTVGSVEPVVQRIEQPSTAEVKPPEVATPAAPVQRRLGLGAPLSAPPPSVQRSATPQQAQLPGRSRIGEPMPEVPRPPEVPEPDREVSAPVESAVELPSGETVAPLLADAPPMVQRTEAGLPEAASAVAPLSMPVRAEPSPQVRAGGSPAMGPVPLQRSPEPALVDVDVDLIGTKSRVGLVGERGLELSVAPTPVQRTEEDAQGRPPEIVAPTGRASAPRPPSVQRVTRVAVPHVAPPATNPTDPGSVAVAAGIAQRMPDGSVLFAPPLPVPGPAAPPATVTQLPYVQRTYEEAPEPAPTPVQRAPDPPSPDPPPAVPPSPPPPGAPPPASGPPPQAESTDDLVRRLIDPLSRLLRAELRLDRERAGLRLDGRN